jgi:hypothetical protein
MSFFRVDHFVIGWSVRKPLFLETFGHHMVFMHAGVSASSLHRRHAISNQHAHHHCKHHFLFRVLLSVIKLLAWLSGCGCWHI